MIPVSPVTILQPVNNFKPVIILEPGGRMRPGLYADIPVPVLEVPSGEEGGPGRLQNFLKEEAPDRLPLSFFIC